MRTDTRVQADPVDNLLRIQPFHLRVGVQLIEIADPEGKVCIGKELDRLRFGKSHDESILNTYVSHRFGKSFITTVFFIQQKDNLFYNKNILFK